MSARRLRICGERGREGREKERGREGEGEGESMCATQVLRRLDVCAYSC